MNQPARRSAVAASTVSQRVLVTGIGVVAPTGADTDRFWKATREGTCRIDRVGRYPTDGYPVRLAGELADFRGDRAVGDRIAAQTDRFTQIALAAAEQALLDASFDPAGARPYEVGVVTASCAGGVEFGQSEIQRLWARGPRFVGPYQSIAWFYAASTGQISIRHGLKGPCGVVVSDEAGGLDAVAHARHDLADGAVAMLAGGAEAPLAPFSMTCQYPLHLLSSGTDPATGYLPFTAAARGFVPAEGGAMLLLEPEPLARHRGTGWYGEVAGHGASFTGVWGSPDAQALRSHAGLVRATGLALAEAGCRPEQVDVVFADAIGVPEADRAEAAALRDVFGARIPPVTAPKTGFGRAYAGAAAIDTATALLALRHQVVPPTPQVTQLSYDLDLVVGEARTMPVRTALVWARGLSGMNSALVLRAVE